MFALHYFLGPTYTVKIDVPPSAWNVVARISLSHASLEDCVQGMLIRASRLASDELTWDNGPLVPCVNGVFELPATCCDSTELAVRRAHTFRVLKEACATRAPTVDVGCYDAAVKVVFEGDAGDAHEAFP